MNIISLLGLLAFGVNIIVEMIKEVGPLKKVPTQSVAIVVSFIVCILGSILYINYAGIQVGLGVLIPSILLGAFPVAYIAMFGFDTFKSLYEKFNK